MRRRDGARRGGRNGRLERGEHALAIGLAERDQPAACRNPVRRHRMQEGMQRGLKRNAMRGADEAGGVVTVAGPENSSFSLVTMKEG